MFAKHLNVTPDWMRIDTTKKSSLQDSSYWITSNNNQLVSMQSRRKRKKMLSNSAHNLDDRFKWWRDCAKTLPYLLQKKLDKSYQTKSKIEVKGDVGNPQITITLDTAGCGLFKDILSKRPAQSKLKLHPIEDTDKSSAKVFTVLKVDDHDGNESSMTNFCNTTSCLLVNRNKSAQCFVGYYSKVLVLIPMSLADSMYQSS